LPGKEKRERKKMSIISGQKKWVLLGILVVMGGGAAFVYFDPLDLDLLGSKNSSAVVQPVAPPRVAATAAKSPVTAPKAAAAPAQVIAPVAAPAASPSPAAAPVATMPAATPVVAAPVVTPSVAAPAQALQPPLKLSKTIKTAKKSVAVKPDRPKDQDLRSCLDLEDDKVIAKCAGE
jgi:hypothetical protein